jgi:hypothetical protein
MLTYRLTGTTEASGSTTTNPASLNPSTHPGQETPNLHTPWRGTTGAAGLLTCDDAAHVTTPRNPPYTGPGSSKPTHLRESDALAESATGFILGSNARPALELSRIIEAQEPLFPNTFRP